MTIQLLFRTIALEDSNDALLVAEKLDSFQTVDLSEE
jgi:hypothetical protein